MTNLAGTVWLQSEQFRVAPWWKAVVLVKESTMLARHTGDLRPSPRWRLSQGIGESCKQQKLASLVNKRVQFNYQIGYFLTCWQKEEQCWQLPSSLRDTRKPGLRGRLVSTVSSNSQVSSIRTV